MPTDPRPKYLSASQASREYGIPRRSVYDLIKRGFLPETRIPGRNILILREALETLLARATHYTHTDACVTLPPMEVTD